MTTHPSTEAPDPRCGECGGQVVAHRCVDCRTRHGLTTTCPTCTHPDHEGIYCGGWEDTDPSEPLAYGCACSYPDSDNYAEVPERSEPEDGRWDEWWPASKPGDPPVNGVALLIAHHHATNHDAGGGGDLCSCEGCDFAIEAGVVLHGGWVRWGA